MKREPIHMHCDKCDKPFTITKTRNILVKDGIEKTYYRCTHCKQEYIVSYASETTSKLQKEMRKLQKSIHQLPDDSEETLKAHWNSVDDLKAKVKQSMDNDRRIAES